KAEAIRTIGREVLAPRGLAGSYEDYVDYCKDEFATVLRIFADPAAYPILFHCQHGKDRTGIVAMLLLGILGVDDDIIAADYALSQKNLETVRDRMILLDMGAVGLPESFCDSPASAMHNLLRHIRAKYGSVRGYLLSAGLREQE
ncbi:protein-tyrosine phosphatase-like protein, partial [Kickxella alabastrina]|uniref:protein-tyrosine phosphatase-like protein n=1 Tax=Kickxella alabastrina TaxID=61397 RepID=UPI00221F6693